MSPKLMLTAGIIVLDLLLCLALAAYQYRTGLKIRRYDTRSPIHNGFYLLLGFSLVVIILNHLGLLGLN